MLICDAQRLSTHVRLSDQVHTEHVIRGESAQRGQGDFEQVRVLHYPTPQRVNKRMKSTLAHQLFDLRAICHQILQYEKGLLQIVHVCAFFERSLRAQRFQVELRVRVLHVFD